MGRRLTKNGSGTFIAIVAALAAAQPSPLRARSPDTGVDATFARPDPRARPWVRWWWPGGDVSPEEIEREIHLLRANGFGGAEVQPFNPGIKAGSPEVSARIQDYATPSFFHKMKYAVGSAARNGLAIDYTFGSAWPAGGGFAISPDRALRELTMAFTEVRGGQKGPFKIAIPARSRKMGAFNSLDPRSRDPRVAAAKVQFDAIQKIVAVVAIRGDAPDLKPVPKGGFALFPWRDVARPGTLDMRSAIILTENLTADGTLDWAPPLGRWQVFVFKEYATNSGVSAGVGEGPQLVADHFDEASFAAHAGRVGDPMIKALGAHAKGLRATFIDSLELMPDMYWSRDFLAEFQRRRGYDLTPYLPLVLQPGWMQAWGEHYSPAYFDANDIGDRIRADYRQTVSDLLIDRFLSPFVAWNHRNGLLARFQAHGAPMDIIKGYGLADIPETEDLLEDGNPYLMRFARSGARLYGRSIISAESMVWKGRPYSATLGQMRQRADLIFASGVNELVIHGMPYAYQRDQWPGWHPFGPIGFSTGFSSMLTDSNPIWAGVTRLTGYITRMQSLMRQGEAVVPVAYFLGETGYYDGIEMAGAKHSPIERALLAGGYDYDRINAESLASSKVVDRALVTESGARFPALVLPPLKAIRAETAELLAAFARQGLPIFFIDAEPTRELGFLDHQARDQRVAAALSTVMQHGGKVVSQAGLSAMLRNARVPANLSFTGDARDLVFVQRLIGRRAFTFVHNNSPDTKDADFDIASTGRVTRWDANTGMIEAYPSTEQRGVTHIPLKLAPGASALLVLDPFAPRVPANLPQMIAEQRLPVEGWQLNVNGHGVAGVTVNKAIPLTTLADYAKIDGLERFSGIATYKRRFRIDRAWRLHRTRIVIDLGQVHDQANVHVNGKAFPTLIGPDWSVDVTDAVRGHGDNDLVVEVVNTPNNAMIDTARTGFRDIKPVPAGLIGPVIISAVR